MTINIPFTLSSDLTKLVTSFGTKRLFLLAWTIAYFLQENDELGL